MRRAVRVGLVALGAAIAVYGAASLTGGWLGTPPWWETRESRQALIERRTARMHPGLIEWQRAELASGDPRRIQEVLSPSGPQDRSDLLPFDDPTRGERFEGEYGITLRPARRWNSAGVVAAGLALVAVGAWPRRRATVES